MRRCKSLDFSSITFLTTIQRIEVKQAFDESDHDDHFSLSQFPRVGTRAFEAYQRSFTTYSHPEMFCETAFARILLSLEKWKTMCLACNVKGLASYSTHPTCDCISIPANWPQYNPSKHDGGKCHTCWMKVNVRQPSELSLCPALIF